MQRPDSSIYDVRITVGCDFAGGLGLELLAMALNKGHDAAEDRKWVRRSNI